MDRKERIVEAQIAALRGAFESEREELLRIIEEEKLQEKVLSEQRMKIARMRKVDRIEGTDAGSPAGKDGE